MPTLTFKVTDEEARQIRASAKRAGLSVSEYLRRRAASEAEPSKKPLKVRCSHTGAMIFAGVPDQPPLTTEALRDMLSDFP